MSEREQGRKEGRKELISGSEKNVTFPFNWNLLPTTSTSTDIESNPIPVVINQNKYETMCIRVLKKLNLSMVDWFKAWTYFSTAPINISHFKVVKSDPKIYSLRLLQWFSLNPCYIMLLTGWTVISEYQNPDLKNVNLSYPQLVCTYPTTLTYILNNRQLTALPTELRFR